MMVSKMGWTDNFIPAALFTQVLDGVPTPIKKLGKGILKARNVGEAAFHNIGNYVLDMADLVLGTNEILKAATDVLSDAELESLRAEMNDFRQKYNDYIQAHESDGLDEIRTAAAQVGTSAHDRDRDSAEQYRRRKEVKETADAMLDQAKAAEDKYDKEAAKADAFDRDHVKTLARELL